jgi:hypothetical protein
MSLKAQEILEIKEEIANIQDYMESDVCRMCEEMRNRLLQCEKLLDEYSRSNMDYPKPNS